MGNLRWRNTGGEYSFEDERAQLIAQPYNLESRLLGALLDLMAGAANTLLHELPYLRESCLPLCIPLLQLLIASLKDLGPGGAQFLFIRCRFGLSRGNGAACLLERT